MDINQIKYLLTIVDNDYNLSKSAEVLHISQPALSKSIKDLEFRSESKIFNRSKGRITGLTHYGKLLISESRKVYEQYESMIMKLRRVSEGHNGVVRIGIAPVIISTVFNEALIDFIKENPGVQLKLTERGAYELQKLLVLGKIDLAVIVSPATMEGIYEEPIYANSVRVWFNKKHRFSNYENSIPFKEVEQEKIVTLTDEFMVTFQLNKLFRRDRIKPQYFLQTQSWDLILNLVSQNSELVGIVAAPIGQNYGGTALLNREMDPVFPWKISLCYTMNTLDDPIVDFSKKWFLEYFSKYKKINIQ